MICFLHVKKFGCCLTRRLGEFLDLLFSELIDLPLFGGDLLGRTIKRDHP